MLYKSLEFKNVVGQKVKVMDIPVLEEDNPNYFMLRVRLQQFINQINKASNPKKCYSFRDYLKRILKWTVYERLFKTKELKNNA